MSLLELQRVHVHYGLIQALKGISLTVERGEIVTLLGANGAGKTSTLRAISGLVRPSAGRILLEGTDLTHRKPHEIVELGVGHVPEGRRIFPRLSVEDNLRLGAFTVHDRTEIARRQEYVFTLFPRLAERRKQPGGTLSGGEQQMLAIGRALMMQPRILLLDEPSMGLAPVLVESIFEVIQRLNRDGTTILLVEQNARMALEIAHRGYVLETGEIVLAGSAAELARDPRVQAAYLGAA
ncbi:ABC transporter ATP-binding protein [Thermomicrobium sp. CFH 73360]|uniref:ABC transporter ATP-binding protein n=1 Tax=Thermomicrobium sp. CFH 73360 TaxID=2951987 RepID=UPI0020776B1A|nr:ABC transporter ATP-binding protein [Thermomicrobium sp. CFH 73360]MCM8746466.1 ABC transporter ATP-binding protein [Thermomicrobium sp. CFH 73360]